MSMGTNVVMGRAPSVGLPVKLKKGMLTLSARQVQHVKRVKKLEVGKDVDTYGELDSEGGYWITTEYTNNEWWAWSLFRIA